jgi:alanine-glyoxylate transaminase/serine-glyoxylate transaminase/serine-pyruvate transaminase
MSINLLNPPERLLLGPGPSNPDPAVRAAMAAPLVGHMDPYFLEVMDQTMAGLRYVFRTDNHHTLPMSATGTGGLETLLFNLVEPGDEVVAGVIGYFGQRLVELAQRAGARVRRVDAPLGQVIEPDRIRAELDRHAAKLVILVHAETSTGACQPLEEVGAICRERGALLVVDCVTSLGGMPVDVDAWGVDAAGSCSQKCLGAPPGLAPITLGPRAMAALAARKSVPATWYFDLTLLFKYWGTPGGPKDRAFHHTAPVAAVYGLHEAVRLIQAEGLEGRFARHCAAHERLVAGLERLGLGLFTPAGHRLPMLNVVTIPQGVDDLAVRRALLDRGIEIAGGFAELRGKVWRIGLMGTNATPAVVDTLLAALGEVLE